MLERRNRFNRDRKYLEGCRRRYARICYKTFKQVPDEQMAEWFNHIAAAGIRRGYWAMGYQTPRQKERGEIPKGSMNSARFRILREWSKIELEDRWRDQWFWWLAENGFVCYTFEFRGKRQWKVRA